MAEPDVAVLLERAAELESLDRLLVSARESAAGAVAVIEGPPGIGKSALLATMRSQAQAQDFLVLGARAGVLEREHPFGVAHQLLGARSSGARGQAAGGGGRGGGRGSAGELLFQRLEEMFTELAALAGERPLLLCVNDAHWADAESLRLCAYLAARIDSLAGVLVLAARPGEAGEERGLLASIATSATVLSPRPLSSSAVAALVNGALDIEADPRFASACEQASGGNPFLLSELLTTVRIERIEPSSANTERVRAMTPAGVAHAVLVRLAQVGPDARRFAGALAVLGDRAQPHEAAALAGLSPPATATAIDELTAADVLAPADVLAGAQPLRFRHPLVRNAVYADLPPSERETAHTSAARLLDGSSETDPDRVAAHLLAVSPAQDAWTASRLIAAGERALQRGACDTAIAYLARALREPPPQDARAELLVSLAQAEAACGSPAAVGHLEQALGLIAEPQRRAQIDQSLGRLFFTRGEYALAGQAAKRALRELHSDEPMARELLADYLAAATFHPPLRADDDGLGEGLLQEVLSGRLPPEPQLCAQVAGAMALWAQPPALVREVAQTAIAAGAAETETSQGIAAAFAGGALILIGEYELAGTVLESALENARRDSSAIAAAQANQVLASVRFHQGRLYEAASHANAALQLSHAGWSFLVPLAASTLALAELAQGEPRAAHAAIHAGEQLSEERTERALVLIARGRLAAVEGAHERALADYEAAGAHALRCYGVEQPAAVPWRQLAALATAQLGDHAHATELAGEAIAVARALGTARPLGTALSAAGQIARGEHGIELLTEAVTVLQRSQSRLEHADALINLGCALRHTGQPRDARKPLREGLQIARACGATPLAARAHEELLASGARPRKILQGGPDALTPAERRVATMAAEGLTNNRIAQTLVVSVRTVETHLAHVYTKLGVSSRWRLADALTDTEQPPDIPAGQ